MLERLTGKKILSASSDDKWGEMPGWEDGEVKVYQLRLALDDGTVLYIQPLGYETEGIGIIERKK